MATCTVRKNAIAISIIGILLIVIAFSTPCWLENDMQGAVKRFSRMGLWEICVYNFHDYMYLYDRVFQGCLWIPDEEQHFLRDQLFEPGFFIAVQVMFTFCMVIGLLGTGLVFVYGMCVTPEGEVFFLKLITGFHFTTALLGTLSVIVFGARGDGRDWMPDYDNNNLSWSYALAVVGSFCYIVTTILFFLEQREIRRLEKKVERNTFPMQSQSFA